MPDKTAIITGAGSGIGRETARILSEEGHAVALVGRTEATLQETASSLVGESMVITADISQADQVQSMVKQVEAAWGRIDVLVNNAAAVSSRPIEKTSPEHLQEMMAVNALGPANAICACWPLFRKQKSGCIVSLSTMATLDPYPGFFTYAGTKAPVNLFTKSAAQEGKRINVRAFAVAPGAVETDMLRSIFNEKVVPKDRTLRPEQVAQVIVDCVLGKNDDRNGEVITVPSS